MSSELTSQSTKPRRIPKKGIIFAVVRVSGLVLIVLGLLLLVVGVIGFMAALIRGGPTLLGSLQYTEQQMAGFIFLISLVYLLIFPLVGLVGAVMAGMGLLLGHVGTEPAVQSSAMPPGST